MPTATAATRTRNPKRQTRNLILAAAFEMYLDGKLIHGDERLATVLDDLGYTTGAGYQIWANQAEFRQELQVHLAENIPGVTLTEPTHTTQAKKALLEPTFEAATIAVAETLMAAWNDTGTHSHLLWRFHAQHGAVRAPETSEALHDTAQRIWWETGTLIGLLLDRYGYRLTDGETTVELSRALTRVLDGERLTSAALIDDPPPDLVEAHGRTTTRLARDLANIITTRVVSKLP